MSRVTYKWFGCCGIAGWLFGLALGNAREWGKEVDEKSKAAQVRKLYRGYRYMRYRLQYSAQRRYEGSEVMFFSHNLALPHFRESA